MNTDPAPAAPATPATPATPVLGMASLSLAGITDLTDLTDLADYAGLPNSAGIPDHTGPGLGPRANGSHGSPNTPSTPKRDTKRRRVAYSPVTVPVSLDSVPRGSQGPQGQEGPKCPRGPRGPQGPRGPKGPRRKRALSVTIPWNPRNGTGIAHRPRPKSGLWCIDDEPHDLADVGIVGIAQGLADLAAPSVQSVLPTRPRVRAEKTLCNYPTQGHLFYFPTHEPSWQSLMAPHATDEFLGPLFLGPQFLGPQFLGQLFRELGPIGQMDAMGPWDCEDQGKYSRKELGTIIPSATMVSAAMTVRMATSPDFLFCDESPLGPLGPLGYNCRMVAIDASAS